MTGWLKLSDEQRKETLTQAQSRNGILVKALEKDWWVTLVLKALFQSAYKDYLVFKGGTSLSKGWKLISRFSEDIDIALDPEAFGMKYEEAPTKNYITKLKKQGCVFTSTKLKEELAKQLSALGVPEGMVSIEADPIPDDFPDTDPQVLHVKYRSLYDPNRYIAEEVKIEVSVRSLKTPFTARPIQSILWEAFPNAAYAETPFEVMIVEPRKTFLEKAFLLHEEFGKPDKSKIRYARMSRHFYDIVMNMDSGVGADALADHELYDHLIVHRQGYSRIPWVDYQTLQHETLSFVPPFEMLEQYRNDYAAMQEAMIYGDPPGFDELIERMKQLQGRFRLKKDGRHLEDVLAIATVQAEKIPGDIVSTVVVYVADPALPEGPGNNNGKYEVYFKRRSGKLIFEHITIIPGN